MELDPYEASVVTLYTQYPDSKVARRLLEQLREEVRDFAERIMVTRLEERQKEIDEEEQFLSELRGRVKRLANVLSIKKQGMRRVRQRIQREE